MQWKLDYLDKMGLCYIVWKMESPDNQRYVNKLMRPFNNGYFWHKAEFITQFTNHDRLG